MSRCTRLQVLLRAQVATASSATAALRPTALAACTTHTKTRNRKTHTHAADTTQTNRPRAGCKQQFPLRPSAVSAHGFIQVPHLHLTALGCDLCRCVCVQNFCKMRGVLPSGRLPEAMLYINPFISHPSACTCCRLCSFFNLFFLQFSFVHLLSSPYYNEFQESTIHRDIRGTLIRLYLLSSFL